MKLDDDFVMTIDDDEEVAIEEEDVPEEETDKKKQASKDETNFDTEFTFAIDGGGKRNQNAWDFTAAHGMLKKKVITYSLLRENVTNRGCCLGC